MYPVDPVLSGMLDDARDAAKQMANTQAKDHTQQDPDVKVDVHL